MRKITNEWASGQADKWWKQFLIVRFISYLFYINWLIKQCLKMWQLSGCKVLSCQNQSLFSWFVITAWRVVKLPRAAFLKTYLHWWKFSHVSSLTDVSGIPHTNTFHHVKNCIVQSLSSNIDWFSEMNSLHKFLTNWWCQYKFL